MKTLENNEILNGLLNNNENEKVKAELQETLWEKTYDLKTFYWYLSRHVNKYYDSDYENHPIRKELQDLFDKIYHKWEDRISEGEVRRIMKVLNDFLSTKREILRESFTQDIPYYKADFFDRDYYLDWIRNRSLPIEEYEKMQSDIEKHGSILSRTNRRRWWFGGGDGSIILSLTNWKIYDVEWSGEKELEEDYKSSRYYTSRSWASAAWNIYAGKWSLIYMPSSRIDVAHPSLDFRDINGLNVTMCTCRWVIDEDYPTVITSWKVNLWVDAVFLSQKDHLQQWMAKDLINTIETKGENLKDWPVYLYKIKCYDENLQPIVKTYSFKTNMNPNDASIKSVARNAFCINRWFDVEDTWSFIDWVVWIKKHGWKYVRLWKYWLVKEVFDEHPDSDYEKIFMDEIEIWDKNEIIHKKEEVQPLLWGSRPVKKFNWWVVWDKFAYKNVKGNHNLYDFDYEDICSEHGIEYNEELKSDDVYHLVYEDDISKYNQLIKWEWKLNMEFEYYVPESIFEKFSTEYWKNFLAKKLEEKVIKGLNIHSLSETMQKNIVVNYLMANQNRIFTLQDSYDSWNCHPWTDRFVKTFGLSDKISGKDLLKHKGFQKMLGVYDFRKIFVRKALEK